MVNLPPVMHGFDDSRGTPFFAVVPPVQEEVEIRNLCPPKSTQPADGDLQDGGTSQGCYCIIYGKGCVLLVGGSVMVTHCVVCP